MLRKIRIGVSLAIFLLISFYFLDFADLLPKPFHALAHIQLVPALLALQTGILIFLFLLTLAFGRIYCSSICPLGVYQDIVAWISKKALKKKNYKYSPALTILRWSVVVVTLFAFAFGFSFLVGLLDPYSAFGRIMVHVFKPAYLAGNNLLAQIFSRFGNNSLYQVGIYALSISSLIVALTTLLGISFLAWKNGRTYCNTICPVGTILGFLSRFSFFKIRLEETKCNSCGLCARNCKASCINAKIHTIDYSRCVNCFDCIDACKQKAMHYRFSPGYGKPVKKDHLPDKSKRRFIVGVAVATIAASKLAAEKKFFSVPRKKAVRKTPISPPGSKSAEHLLKTCTACHLCVSKCPSQVIKPSLVEYGLGGMMQPMLSFEKGFCNYDCTLCSEICPNGALTPLTPDMKRHNQMGQVRFITENCIVYTYENSCGACSEHCPTQAVSMIPYKNDLTIPHTDTSICVGCGGCEYVCPAKPEKAIYVEGVAEHKRIEIKKEKADKTIKVDNFGF